MKNKISTTASGRAGEREAAAFLEERGYRILEMNYRYSHREIDIIAENNERLLFVEVKSRTDNAELLARFGRPAAAVTKQKQKLIISAAYYYLKTHETAKRPRLDVIEVYFKPIADGQSPVVSRIHHIENAFPAR